MGAPTGVTGLILCTTPSAVFIIFFDPENGCSRPFFSSNFDSNCAYEYSLAEESLSTPKILREEISLFV